MTTEWTRGEITLSTDPGRIDLEVYRGRGLARWMLDVIHAHPELQGLRRWLLATRDAHALYRGAGYTTLESPERLMERRFKNVYRGGAGR